MSDKNIYDLLNEVETDIGEIEEMDELEKKKYKNNFKNRSNKKNNRMKKTVIAAALIVTLGLGSQTNLGKDVYAAAQSKFDDIGYSISRALNKEESIEPYSNVVNQIVENKDIGIKLSHVIIDRDELIISSLLDSSNANSDINYFKMDTKVYINGERIHSQASSGSSGHVESNKDLLFDIQELDIENIDVNKEMDIRIVFNKFSYTDDKGKQHRIAGDWEYKFKASGDELSKKTEVIVLNHEFKIEDENYKLNEFSYNPVNQKIFGEYTGNDELGHNIELRGEDSLGNDVVFYLSRKIDNRLIFTSQNQLSDDIDYIKLKPYGAEYEKKNGKSDSDYKLVGDEFIIRFK